MLTDAEISRLDSKQTNPNKELVPWDGGHGDSEDTLDSLSLDEHNGVSAQNGWSPDEMFKMNEAKFQVKSTYDPSLPDYTYVSIIDNYKHIFKLILYNSCPLVKGEGPDYEEKQKTAQELAQQIESDPSRIERYAREDADDEDKYSAVVRPTNESRLPDRNRMKKANSSPNPNNYVGPNSGASNSSGARQPSRGGMGSNTAPTAPPFQRNNNYRQPSNTGSNQNQSSHKTQNQSYREEQTSYSHSAQNYNKSGDNEEPLHTSSGPQRGGSDNRRPTATNKRKEESSSTTAINDLKKFGNEFKLSSNVDTNKDKDIMCQKSESQMSHTKHSNSAFSAKSKSPVGAGDAIPVKDSVGLQSPEDSLGDKDLREVRESSDQRDNRDSIDSASAHSPTGSVPETEIAKKSTLNPNAKTFTPRSPMTPLTTSATPPSVASTPSSTVSVPISGQLTHVGPHGLSQGHSQSQVGSMQSATHASQARFANPLVQIPPQYNVLTPGLTPLLAHNQYLMTNVAAMAPSFQQQNPNQQRNYRTKGPQQYSHGVRHEFTPQSAHVAAQVTGHPVLATAPIGTPQTVNYGTQQTTTMVAAQGHPQHMYQHMYPFPPRMNVLPQHSAMQMGVPQAVQYDPTQLQHIYSELSFGFKSKLKLM